MSASRCGAGFFAIFFFRTGFVACAGCAAACSFTCAVLFTCGVAGTTGLTAGADDGATAGSGRETAAFGWGEGSSFGAWTAALRSAARTSGGADRGVSMSEGARSTDRPATAPPIRSVAATRYVMSAAKKPMRPNARYGANVPREFAAIKRRLAAKNPKLKKVRAPYKTSAPRATFEARRRWWGIVQR